VPPVPIDILDIFKGKGEETERRSDDIYQNLGLGVLEEKRNGDNTESENESNSEESSHSSSDAKIRSLHEKRKVTDVLRRLMGNKSKPKKPGIEEVDDSSKKE
jgi:NOP protein chaperone 1